MAESEAKKVGWFPLRGSWEEAVLSWNEQVDSALRRQKLSASSTGKEGDKRLEPRRTTKAARSADHSTISL